jgi:threonine/homoserine/homoserine lactone efflux protein
MPTMPTLLTFAVAATLLIIVPGPNVLYIIARGIDQGRKAAAVSALGVQAGMFVHVTAAILGLSAIVAKSDLLFNVIKFAGAAYLIWMGITTIRSKVMSGDLPGVGAKTSYRRIFVRGMIVNVLNVKVILFFLAFLPQFVRPERGSSSVQILVLGLVFVVISIMSDMLYAMASGSIGNWLSTREKVSRQRNRFTGAVYILLGAFAALTGSGSAQSR